MIVLDLASMAATLAPVLGGEGGNWRRAADMEGFTPAGFSLSLPGG